jgi:hypothetical protein
MTRTQAHSDADGHGDADAHGNGEGLHAQAQGVRPASVREAVRAAATASHNASRIKEVFYV